MSRARPRGARGWRAPVKGWAYLTLLSNGRQLAGVVTAYGAHGFSSLGHSPSAPITTVSLSGFYLSVADLCLCG